MLFSKKLIRNDREIVPQAAKENGHALQHAPAALKGDREIVTEAVDQDGRAVITLEYLRAETEGTHTDFWTSGHDRENLKRPVTSRTTPPRRCLGKSE